MSRKPRFFKGCSTVDDATNIRNKSRRKKVLQWWAKSLEKRASKEERFVS